ncbi:exodeoxyribonuclease V subunit beta [Leptospira kobayashii]|uniref:RecBCD enzyme subunit RecB n=1 Tax=Leptospira kobayashii TaxID=1917830 RepID=A0ABM7UID1_9LEPT|nr:UvrD-helicase domain-containing protein [Leptospira kobayashii]BDA78371.1 exodeoxyribonuclease V subunit beta [Leptospira kobayashii]
MSLRPFPLQHSFIEASAGSGKTYTIMEIVSDLIQFHHIPLSKILILTYTEKAAGELKERLRKKLVQEKLTNELRDLDSTTISTIHGFCNMVLGEYPIETETFDHFKITDVKSKAKLLLYDLQHNLWNGLIEKEKLAKLLSESNFFKSVDKILFSVEKLLSGKSYPYKMEEWNSENFKQNTAILIAENLKEEFKTGEWMSYDQMVLKLRDSLRTNPHLKEALSERYQVGIIDEFQDTDAGQYEIFSSLFLEKENQALYLIGDPKQSIYGFRGIDLGTYLGAKQELIKNGARLFHLEYNFRSVPELISAYNKIIGHFFPIEEIEEKVDYIPVLVPEETSLKTKKSPEDTEDSIHILRLSENKLSIGEARDLWIDCIAAEIDGILNSGKALSYIENEKKKIIGPKDISVLVDSRRNGILVGQALKERGIPFTLYKQQGIYQSEESIQIQNILECLLDPNKPSSYRKILLSDIFKIHPKYLASFDEHSIDSYEKTMLNRWKVLATERKFAELFRSIEEDSRILLNEEETDIIWERKRTNYRQIFRKLLQFQIAKQVGLEEVLKELVRLGEEKTNEEELPLYEKETEKDAVQILTLHASKGLEWPIVFLFHLKGYLNSYHNSSYSYSIAENGKRIHQLDLWNADNKTYLSQLVREDKRLFYVGMTRPKYRLYLPYFETSSNSPYKNFVHAALTQSIGTKGIGFRDYIPRLKLEKKSQRFFPEEDTGKPLYFQGDNLRKTIEINSYSSLRAKEEKEKVFLFNDSDSKKKSDDEKKNINEIADLLPSSANTGSYLHSLLETSDFSWFMVPDPSDLYKNEKLRNKIDYHLDRFGLISDKPEYERRTMEIIWNSLNAEMGADRFRLAELSKEDRVAEMDFHLYLDHPKYKSLPQGPGNFLKGSIDLVFSFKGKFYLADYKSNLLSDYSSSHLEDVISDPESRYDLQRDIYALVLAEYLKHIYGENDALSKLGGVYYFFLRGMKVGKQDGIYFDGDWNEERLIKIQSEVQRLTGEESLS